MHAYCFYTGEEYDDERTLAAKCGPQCLRNAKRISRGMAELEGYSKSFEDKYLRSAKDRLDKGVREVVPPQEDMVLKQMK